MKRILSVLLTLALALALALPLALPAFADGEPNPAMPVITVQPNPKDIRVKFGESFTLSAEAVIPNGDEVRYEWFGVGKNASVVSGVSTENTFSLGRQGAHLLGACFRVHMTFTLWRTITPRSRSISITT